MGCTIKDTGNESNAWYDRYCHPYVAHKVSVPSWAGLVGDYRLKCDVHNTRAKGHQSSYVMDTGNSQLLGRESAQWLAAMTWRNWQRVHMNVNFMHDILIRGTKLNTKGIISNSSFALVSWLETSPDLEQISHPVHVSVILLANKDQNALFTSCTCTVKRLKACKPPFPGSWAIKDA